MLKYKLQIGSHNDATIITRYYVVIPPHTLTTWPLT